MKHLIDPGRTRPSIFHFDHIVYSHVEDLNGDPLALELSILSPMEGKELQIALGRKKPEENPDARTDGAVGKAGVNQRPVIVWFNGNGFREVDKHCQIGDLAFLAEAGYAVCFVQFRNSAQGKLPAQLIDAKTAIRFLRAHAAQYSIDPNGIAVAGRSAGGMIVSMLGLNDDRFLSEEWAGYSSSVQAVWDLFGLVDLARHSREEVSSYKNGTADTNRWKRAEDTHTGAVIGGNVDTMPVRAEEFTAQLGVHDKMPPFLIMHGDADPAVPYQESVAFYDKISSYPGNDVDLYLVHGAGHGTPEFFQPAVQKIALDFFEKTLRG